MKIQLFKEIILNSQKETIPDYTKRSLTLHEVDNMSLSIVGVRRAGKTFRTYQYIDLLLKKGISQENICRIQFNDYRLRGLSLDQLSGIEEAFFSIYPEKQASEVIYFIFDEIHRIDGWEDYILHLLDKQRNKVLITGSTSKLLTGDIASALRGKNFSVVQFPFSFKEFLLFHSWKWDTDSSEGKARLRSACDIYLNQGGFPGLLTLPETMYIPLLQNYTETMLLRDIIEAHPHDRINIITFSDFYQALISRIGCPMSINKIAGTLKEKGLKFSNETLYKYLEYLKEAFMLYTVEFYSLSEKIRGANYRKVYSIDWALAGAIAPAMSIDITRKFENLIFLELMRRDYRISYFRTKDGYEIDFVITEKMTGKQPMLIQVCYDMGNKDVRVREFRAIRNSAFYLNSRRNIIITMDEEETVQKGGVEIEIIPAWKWLVGEM